MGVAEATAEAAFFRCFAAAFDVELSNEPALRDERDDEERRRVREHCGAWVSVERSGVGRGSAPGCGPTRG